MDDEQLRAELEVLLRKQYEATFERSRRRQQEENLLSDGEWWQMRVDAFPEHNTQFAAQVGGRKDEMIRQRHAIRMTWTEEGLDHMIATEAAKLMPALQAVRHEAGEDGTLTEEQYQSASMRHSLESIDQMSAKLQEAAVRETDPRRKEFLSQFAANVQADLADMDALRDPAVTEEQLEEVTAKMTGRMDKLTKSLHPPEGGEPQP